MCLLVLLGRQKYICKGYNFVFPTPFPSSFILYNGTNFERSGKMSNILVVVGAITSATRLAKRLTQNGDRNVCVISTPIELGGSGCSYSVRASLASEQFIRNNSGGITIKRIYIEEQKGKERYYRDIS